MSTRYILGLALCLCCQALFAGQFDNYPFSVDSEKVGDGHRIIARNNGPAPVSVRVDLTNSYYIQSDRPFPIYAVVPPNGGTMYLANIGRAMSGVGYTFTTRHTWLLGDYNAGPAPDALYRMPYQDGAVFPIGQAPGGPISTHTTPENRFAVDIGMPEGTPVLAARDGLVIHTEANQIYGAKDPELLSKANEVKIQHVDGTIAVYAHFKHGGVFVYPGQRVRAGDQIGLAGSTGYSAGPHLHFDVQVVRKKGEGLAMESVPYRFYIGNPPTAFNPQFGMMVRANYAGPASLPGANQPLQIAPVAPVAHSPAKAPQGAPAAPEVVVSIDPAVVSLLRQARARLVEWDTRVWGGLVLLVTAVFIFRTRMARERSRRELKLYREPTLRD